ncbi:phage tail tape measure protein [Bacillus mycoides]|uniref:phage tail tape measure protein n=1 Tax=Bacillus mycoides TaxID=1405 RepID=UPI003D6625D1
MIDRNKELKKVILDSQNLNSKAQQKLRAEYKKNQQAITQFNRDLRGSRSLSNNVASGMIKSFKAVGATLLAAFSVRAIARFFDRAIESFATFEQAMAGVKAFTGATGEEFQKLEEDARRLGETTVFTATEVANLQTEFAKKGFDTQEILNATEATLALAAATQEDLVTSAEVASNTLRAYGLDAAETSKVTDIMAASFTSSALDLEKFREAQKLIGPIAKAANVDLETTTAVLSKLADKGISGSIAGTSLRNLLISMANPASKLSKRLGLVVNSGDDLIKAFDVAKEKGIDLAEAAELTGKRAVTAFSSLAADSGLDVLRENLENSTGAAQEMADIQLDTVQGGFKLLTSATEGMFIALGEKLKPTIQAVTSTFINWITWLKDNISTVIRWGKFLAGLGASMAVFRVTTILSARASAAWAARQSLAAAANAAMSGSLVAGTTAMRAFNAAVAANPIGAVLTAVTLLTTAMGLFSNSVEDAKEEQALLNAELEETERLKTLVGDLSDLAKAADEVDTKTLEEGLNKVGEAADGLRKKADALKIDEVKNEVEELGEIAIGTAEDFENLDLSWIDETEAERLTREAGERYGTLFNTTEEFNEKTLNASKKSLEETKEVLEAELAARKETSEEATEEAEKATKAQIKAQEKYVEETTKLRNQLRALNIDAIEDERERAVELLREKARLEEDRVNKVVGDEEVKAELILAINEKLLRDIEASQKKFDEKRLAENVSNLNKFVNQELAVQELALTKRLAAGSINQQEYEDGLLEIKLDSLDAQKKAYIALGQDVTAIEQEILDLTLEGDAKKIESTLELVGVKRLAEAQLAVLESREGTVARLDAERDLLDAEMEYELSQVELTEEEKAVIREDYRQREEELEWAFINRKADMAGQIASQITQAGFDIALNRIDNELTLERNKNAEVLNELEASYGAGLISKEEYEQQKAAIDAEFQKKEAALKTEQFKKQKQADITQSLINTAVAVTKALPNIPLSILAGALGAIQTGIIVSKPVPKFERGTVLGGESHENGGTQIYGNDGAYYGEAERGEIILTKGVFHNPYGRRIASDLNEAFGGVRFDQAFPSRVPYYRDGGALTQTRGSSEGGDLSAQMGELINVTKEVAKRPIEMPLYPVKQGLNKIEQIENNASY